MTFAPCWSGMINTQRFVPDCINQVDKNFESIEKEFSVIDKNDIDK
jgi:hypothetical protein